MEKSQIRHSDGGSMFSGRAAVDVFACITTAHGIKLYLKTNKQIKPCRGWTERRALEFVRERTGMVFKKSQLAEAAQYLLVWADAKRYGIPEISTRVNDVAHAYAVLRWMLDDRSSIEEDMKNLKITKAADVFDAIDNMATDCGLGDPFAPDWTLSREEIEARKKAIANLREIAK